MIVIGNLLFNSIPVIKPVGSGNNLMHTGDRQIRRYEPSGKRASSKCYAKKVWCVDIRLN